MNIGLNCKSFFIIYNIILLMVLTLCSSSKTTKPFHIDKSKSSHPYGLKDKPLKSAKAKGAYLLVSHPKEEKLKFITKNRYGLINSKKESKLNKITSSSYLLRTSDKEDKIKKLTKNRYGLISFKRKKKQSPYLLDSPTYKKTNSLTKNRYILYTPVKEKEIKSKSPYGFIAKSRTQRQKTISSPYFDYLNNKEDKKLAPYIYRSPELRINKRDYLSSYKNYRKPKIRAFIIVNQDYDDDKYKLRYTENDLIVYKNLFNIILDTPLERIYTTKNITLNSFKSEFNKFIKTINIDELIMIIYSGHSNNNGMPIFTDMKSIKPKAFYGLVNSFANDTVLIMDSSYINQTTTNLIRITEEDGLKENVLRFYSNLVSKDKKEGVYTNKYNKYFRRSYRLLDQINANNKGNGLFTMLFVSFFADFSFSESQAEVRFETINSYINSKISAFQEGSIYIHRPKMLPIIGSKFKEERNNYILFNTLLQRQLLLAKEDQLLKAMYAKAIRLQNQGKYESAVSMFLGVVRRGGVKYKNIDNRLAECYFALGKESSNSEEKINFYRKGLNYIPASGSNLSILGDNYNNLAKKSYNKQNISQSIYYQKKAINIYVQNKNTIKLNIAKKKLKQYIDSKEAQNHLKIGYSQYSKSNYDKAIYHFNKAITIYKKYGDKFNMATCLNNIGAVYNVKKDYNKALEYYKKSLKIKIRIKDIEGMANTYNNIGVIYYNIKRFNSAIKHLKMAIINYKRLNMTDRLVARCYNNIIRAYRKVNNIKQANFYKREKDIIIES